MGIPFILGWHHYDGWSEKLNIKEVHGCIHVEETGLLNLDFLKETNISGCLGHHVISNNPFLCPPLFLEENSGTEVVVSGSQRPYGCGKVCESLSEGNCNIVERWLKITSETKPEDVAELEGVLAGMSIVDTTLESFEFPKLVEISRPTGPVLVVKNNPNLKSLKMPKIQRIQYFADILGPSTVVILNNPKLGEDFAKCIDGVSACVETEKHSCRHDNDRSGSFPYEWLAVGGAVLLVAVLLIIIGVICCYKKKKQQKEKSLKSDTKTTRKETTSQREQDNSKTSTAGTSYSAE